MPTTTLTPCHVKKFGDTKSWSIYPEGAGKSVASVKDEAYAHVMGAAVDMLAALQLIEHDLDYWKQMMADKEHGKSIAALQDVARAAIAKAKG